MNARSFLCPLLPLPLGIVLGAFGTKLFLESLPAPEDPPRNAQTSWNSN